MVSRTEVILIVSKLFTIANRNAPPAEWKIPIKCRLIRADDHGVGVQFLSIDIRDYEELKNRWSSTPRLRKNCWLNWNRIRVWP
jgi:hypothetical protein